VSRYVKLRGVATEAAGIEPAPWARRRRLETIGGGLMMRTLALAAVVSFLSVSSFSAQSDMAMDHPDIHRAADIAWKDGPPSLPAGAKLAVLEGDPAKEGAFTMRLKLPDGYRIMPHTHPKVEPVISGTFNLGMGDRFDQGSAREMPAGTFGHWPAGMKHFAWAKGETIVQLHGIGPWAINYVNPTDDPRNRKQ
jgi:hypothetical protein